MAQSENERRTADALYMRQWRSANPSRAARLDRLHARAYRRRHPGRQAETDRKHWSTVKRFKQYGVTLDWYRDQLVGQAGRCAICGNVFASERETHIDHDHRTGAVRGLLCRSCNQMLGSAKDSPKTLAMAMTYLGGN